jgi:tellurite resistance protein TerC
MQVSAAWWVGFNVGVLALLAFDLLVLHRGSRPVAFRSALGLALFWVALAVVFGAALGHGWVGGYGPAERGPASLQYFTAY